MANVTSLYLVRHAVAAERGDAYSDDDVRPLTKDGMQRFRKAVLGLQNLGVNPDEVLTSPLTRARQTAEILSENLVGRPKVREFAALAPSGTALDVIEALGEYAGRESLALVGHEPNISALAAKLLGARGGLPFKKGAVCRIDVAELPPVSPGELVWFATPRMLRRAAG